MQSILASPQQSFLSINNIIAINGDIEQVKSPIKTNFEIQNTFLPKITPDCINKSNEYFTSIQINPNPANNSQEIDLEKQKNHKERNRIAAQKWRRKKDNTLVVLEEENDILRKEVFQLQGKALQLNVENRVLESELQYFQKFMTTIMSITPKK